MTKFPFLLTLALMAITLSACSPALDWREVHGSNPSFQALLPAKPATLSRPINLGGMQVTMTMTAAEVDDVTFAIGSAQLPAAARTGDALLAMKTAMIRNINGRITHEQSATGDMPTIDIEASGYAARNHRNEPIRLAAHFVARNGVVYQVIVVGPEKAMQREAVDTFLSSFKPG